MAASLPNDPATAHVPIASLVRSEDTQALSDHLATMGMRDLVAELARLDDDAMGVAFRLLERDRAAEVFEALEPTYQQRLLGGLRADRVVHLIEELDPDDRVRLLDEVPAKVANRLLAALSPEELTLTTTLLGYPEESAGRLMSPEFVSLRAAMTVGEALAKIRTDGVDAETIYALPVLDDERHLIGVTGLRALVVADRESLVGDLMNTDVRFVSTHADQEVAARLVSNEGLIALPVVDAEQRLVGVLTVDDAMAVLAAEESEDAALQGARTPAKTPYLAMSVVSIARTRALWLLVLIVAAALTVNVLQVFEDSLAQVVALALFIPLLIDTGGNCGSQASTSMVRALAVADVRPEDVRRVVWREARVGLMLGLMLGAAAFVPVALIWEPNLALVVAATLVSICTWATMAGAALPFVARRLGIDPAVVSAPLITTLVDASGLLIYFGFANLILNI
ncbi:MAG: magnesium transporter [Candidatus Microthrix sp.]|nr:magnesium transporter [Candidatus Microthrix sp.]MBK7321753.1 magnesium transporter [Candidatus Microthrix sp.]